MKNYFADCRTEDEVKKLYRKLVKKLHPDNGGDPEEFKALGAEYDRAFNRVKGNRTAADGTTYQRETTETPEMFRAAVDPLAGLDGIEIELCGSWIWIHGDTRQYKDILKAAGYRWACKKKMWYWHSPEEVHGKHKSVSMATIRLKYGSTYIVPDAALRLEAI